MDIAQDYFDVSHRSPDTSLNDYASEALLGWVRSSPENNSTFLGSFSHTEKDAKAWSIAANFLSNTAEAVDDKFVSALRREKLKYDYQNFGFTGKPILARKERSNQDIRLIQGLLDFVIDALDSRNVLSFFVAQGGLANINRFADLYEFPLQHSLDTNFVRLTLRNVASSMNLFPNYHLSTISDLVPREDLTNHSNLYFAYGSNMDHSQMAHRTPSAKFVGLADLNNFAYYIDDRGVASVIPKVGANVKGMLWDIRDEADWANLDHYEGVKSGFYNRIDTPVMRGNEFVNATIYRSTNTSFGKPRAGYQEKIIEAVFDQLKRSDIVENLFNKERNDQEAYGEIFGGSHDDAFTDWIEELRSWLNK